MLFIMSLSVFVLLDNRDLNEQKSVELEGYLFKRFTYFSILHFQ